PAGAGEVADHHFWYRRSRQPAARCEGILTMESGARFIVALSGAARRVRDDDPIYVISVAAEMAGMHPQTPRQYDRLGLVSPRRTPGGGRRYSPRDVDRLREVQRLSQEDGVNLVGIKRILELENE